jgi:hypothetical protein
MVKIATAGASLLAALLVLSSVPTRALAQARVGGHVGIAVPLVTVTSDDTTNIVDDTVIVNPIGVTVKLTERFAVDFETQVVSLGVCTSATTTPAPSACTVPAGR